MINEVIQQYLPDPVTRHEILRDKDRLVAEVEVDGEVYFLKGEKQAVQFIETVIAFTELMIEAGLPFIMPEKTLNGERFARHEDLLFILERKGVGTEVKVLRLEHFKEIGKMLGKQHETSSAMDFRFGVGTSWGMFGGNETEALGDYDENELSYLDLIQSVEETGMYTMELATIKELYQSRRSTLKEAWNLLPLGPVQGDFCPYNLLFQQDKISTVFDYNIAGDEVLINECIGVGIFLAWHHDFEGDEAPEERFDAYIEAYTSERPLSNREMEMIPYLFAIIRAFRYDRVEEGIEKIKQGDGKAFLDKTIMLLRG
ncbi:phosphotransferase enzyme family protein [Sporosarcina koreensis]|uniref:Phosphotransferase enzyme family protein n=1 Tax=Sporosarcina koreensis TaxID=334735 RepID=A0ABW0TVX9_9BACL